MFKFSNGQALPQIDFSNLEFKEIKTQYGKITGQFRKGTDIIEGIAR